MSIEAMKLALDALETNNKAWKALDDSGDAGWWEAEEQPFYEMSIKIHYGPTPSHRAGKAGAAGGVVLQRRIESRSFTKARKP